MTDTYAGTVPAADQIADRLAIQNLMGIYGAYANEGDFEGWAGLFAEDAIFEIALPGGVHPVDKSQLLAGEQHIFSIYRDRLAAPDTGERRLFLMTNIHVRSQTDSEADVGMTLTLVRTRPDGPSPRIEGTGTYRGTLVKHQDRWLIRRWRVQTDRSPEAMLDTAAHPDAAWER